MSRYRTGIQSCQKLEKLQRETASIVTGLQYYRRSDTLYSETRWEPLSVRREHRKPQLFYNIKNGHAPLYSDAVKASLIYIEHSR